MYSIFLQMYQYCKAKILYDDGKRSHLSYKGSWQKLSIKFYELRLKCKNIYKQQENAITNINK